MNNQQSFLANIRTSLGLPPDIIRGKEYLATELNTESCQTQAATITQEQPHDHQLLEIFCKSAHQLGIHTCIVSSIVQASSAIMSIITSKEPEFTQTKQVICHDHPDLHAVQLDKHCREINVPVHITRIADGQLREKTIASFIGITVADLGIAETATIVQLTVPGHPRSTSLVPSLHIALLHSDNIVLNQKDAYAYLQGKTGPSSFIYITGPSKTADIEATMVHGAHGPREMHIVILSSPD